MQVLPHVRNESKSHFHFGLRKTGSSAIHFFAKMSSSSCAYDQEQY